MISSVPSIYVVCDKDLICIALDSHTPSSINNHETIFGIWQAIVHGKLMVRTHRPRTCTIYNHNCRLMLGDRMALWGWNLEDLEGASGSNHEDVAIGKMKG